MTFVGSASLSKTVGIRNLSLWGSNILDLNFLLMSHCQYRDQE